MKTLILASFDYDMVLSITIYPLLVLGIIAIYLFRRTRQNKTKEIISKVDHLRSKHVRINYVENLNGQHTIDGNTEITGSGNVSLQLGPKSNLVISGIYSGSISGVQDNIIILKNAFQGDIKVELIEVTSGSSFKGSLTTAYCIIAAGSKMDVQVDASMGMIITKDQ